MSNARPAERDVIRQLYYRHLRRHGAALVVTCMVPLVCLLSLASLPASVVRTLLPVWIGTALLALGVFAVRHYRALERDIAPLAQLAAVGKSTAQIAHDLMGPLSSLRVALRDFGEESISSQHTQARLRLLRLSAARLERIAHGVLHPQGEATYSAAVDMHALLSTLVQEYQSHPRMKGVTFITAYTSELVLVRGEQRVLERVLANLIKNAVEAMQCQGQLILHTEAQGSTVEISVGDTGPGLSPELCAAILNGEGQSVGKSHGHGLGLKFVREAIMDHGGLLHINSPAAGGACFTLQLPTASATTEETNVVALSTSR